MFGFHKSKIYRSHDGCCICKTKSSSSRFTDSSRYEETFRLCFGWVFGVGFSLVCRMSHLICTVHHNVYRAGMFFSRSLTPVSSSAVKMERGKRLQHEFGTCARWAMWHLFGVLIDSWTVVNVGCQRTVWGISAMHVSCWWRDGKNCQMVLKRTGTMLWMQGLGLVSSWPNLRRWRTVMGREKANWRSFTSSSVKVSHFIMLFRNI